VAVLEKGLNMDEEAKSAAKPLIEEFIPKLVGKKVIIHLTSGGQPVTGTVERYNPFSRQPKGNGWSSSTPSPP
jgi:hypothetical protein